MNYDQLQYNYDQIQGTLKPSVINFTYTVFKIFVVNINMILGQ